MAVHLFCIDTDEQQADWFREAWKKTGKKLDMGKSCVRFRKLEDCVLNVIGQAINRFPVKKMIAGYEAAIAAPSRGRPKEKATG